MPGLATDDALSSKHLTIAINGNRYADASASPGPSERTMCAVAEGFAQFAWGRAISNMNSAIVLGTPDATFRA